MEGLNRATLVGNLGSDPELRSTQSGKSVLNFTMATSEGYYDEASKQRKEITHWHRVVLWGNRAEPLSRFLHKGSRILVEGRIETRSFEDKDGQKRWVTEINARNVLLLDGKRDEQQQGESRQQNGASRAQSSSRGGQQEQRASGGGSAQPAQETPSQPDFGGFGGADDDVPF